MAHYLVTGGAGFIGSALVRRLVADGHRVRVLDNLSTGKKHNLEGVLNHIEFLEGDLRARSDCASACRGVEVVFHQAALPSVPRSVEDPAGFHENNIDGTFQILLAARDESCRRVIYASSSSVYGDQPELPKHEAILPAPLTPYALNKLVGEYYARVFYESYGLQTLSLRYFNVFGPRQDPKSQYAAAIPAFVSAVLAGRRPIIFGDGEQTRDFTFIDNVVEANVLGANAPETHGEVINVACGQSLSINEVVQIVLKLLNSKLTPDYQTARPGDVKHSRADIARAQKLIGFNPQISFEEGLRRAIEWYKKRS